MSPGGLIWAVAGAALVILAVLSVVQLVRAARQGIRLARRLAAYPEHPVVAALGRAAGDAGRLQGAASEVGPLLARGAAAVATIRRGPPEIRAVLTVLRLLGLR